MKKSILSLVSLFATKISVVVILVLSNQQNNALAQSVDSLKLFPSEIPAGYVEVTEMLNKAYHPVLIYENNDLVSDNLGTIKNKTYQSLKGRGDKGTVFIIELEKPMENTDWLKPFLYGPSEMAPSAMHPEEFIIHDRFLIIWSFEINSKIKQISKEKIQRILL